MELQWRQSSIRIEPLSEQLLHTTRNIPSKLSRTLMILKKNASGAAASLMENAGVDIDKLKVLVEVLLQRGAGDSLYGNLLSTSVPFLLSVFVILSDLEAMKEPTFGIVQASPIPKEIDGWL